MDQAALAPCAGEDLVNRGTQPWGAIGRGEHRRTQPTRDHALEEPDARIGRFGGNALKMQQHRVALGRDAVADQHRLGASAVVHLEV